MAVTFHKGCMWNKLVSTQECANRNFTEPDSLGHLRHLPGTYRGCPCFEKSGKGVKGENVPDPL